MKKRTEDFKQEAFRIALTIGLPHRQVASDLGVGLIGSKQVGFGFIKAWRHIWTVEILCNVMQFTAHGSRKWLTRPISNWQRDDMKMLAHIREQYGVILGSYGKPRQPSFHTSTGFTTHEGANHIWAE